MVKKIVYACITTIIYLIVSNVGNLFFGVSKEFSWTTTLWESFFFFIFVLLLQNYRKKQEILQAFFSTNHRYVSIVAECFKGYDL